MEKIRSILRDELPLLFAGPALVWQTIFLYLPLLGMFVLSFSHPDFFSFTLEHYWHISHIPYLLAIGNSVFLASCTAVLCLLLAYPVAAFLALQAGRFRTLMLVAVILPSWTNFMVQIYSWFFLLEKRSILSYLLYFLGCTSEPTHLLSTYFSTLIGMVYCYTPFMIFPLFAVLEKMDKRLLEASADLGANRLQTFRRVILPLSYPGIQTGMLIVFITSFGEFAIPLLLGGSKNVFWGSLMVEKFLITRDWSAGFALAGVGMLTLSLIMGIILVGNRLFGLLIARGQRW